VAACDLKLIRHSFKRATVIANVVASIPMIFHGIRNDGLKRNLFSSAERASPQPCAEMGPRLIGFMCRAIKTLHNFSPPATNDEIRASSLQFVRKLSGFTKPSRANEEAFNRAVDDVAHAAHHLLESLVSNAPLRNREAEALKAKTRSAKRYGTATTVAA
jgi:hypothetical protein